jgi:hypothetical protein
MFDGLGSDVIEGSVSGRVLVRSVVLGFCISNISWNLNLTYYIYFYIVILRMFYYRPAITSCVSGLFLCLIILLLHPAYFESIFAYLYSKS